MSDRQPGSGTLPLLRLYVAGESPGAKRALANRKQLIKALDGGIHIEIIDILAAPEVAEKAGILATPTLSDDTTDPPRRLIGDISNIAEVLAYFGYPRRDIP